MLGAMPGPHEELGRLEAHARRLEADGLDSLWLANIFGLDAITALAIVGRRTRRIELVTAVVPTYPRHPLAMAQQALTASAAAGGRFTLGIGLSHRPVIEGMLGQSFEKPAVHMREYLAVLGPLLRGEPVRYAGERFRVAGGLRVGGAGQVPILVAALGPVMLRVAGRLADGTLTWMAGPRTLREFIAPALREAAAKAERPSPRVAAGVPLAIVEDRAAARGWAARALAGYGRLPSYRGLLDREGAEGPVDVAVLGSEAEARAGLERLREAGVTDLGAAIAPVDPEAVERTLAFLAQEARRGHG